MNDLTIDTNLDDTLGFSVLGCEGPDGTPLLRFEWPVGADRAALWTAHREEILVWLRDRDWLLESQGLLRDASPDELGRGGHVVREWYKRVPRDL